MIKVLLSLLAISFLSFGANAQERRVMKVGFEDFPPSAFFINGKATGVDVELIAATMKEVGIEVHFSMYPWNRCLAMLDGKELDAVIPMVYSKERDERYSLGTSLRTRGNVIVFSKRVTKDISTINDLSGMTVGLGQGYVISKEFDEATNFRKDLLTTQENVYETLLKKVVTGRNDAAVIDISVASRIIKKLKIENEVTVSQLQYPKATHVGFAKKSPFLPLYEKGLKVIHSNGTYKRIIEKWELN